MKRIEISLAALGLVLLAWGAAWIHAGRGPMRDVMLDGGPACPAAPVRVLEPDSGAPLGSVVIFHGLSANRIVMLTNGQQFAAAGFRVFLPDGPGHGDNTAPFSFAAYESCARGLLATLQRHGQIVPQRTVLLGHSLGGALAVRLADDFPAAATIAVATAPLVFPHRLPANLLLVAPQFDMPPVRDTEIRLASAAGAERTSPADFRQLRAFRLLTIPRKSHTSVLFDPSAARPMLRWALNSVYANSAPDPAPSYRAFNGGCLGFIGIVLLFPAAASAAARFSHARDATPNWPALRPSLSLLAWTAMLILSAILAARWTLLSPLRIYGADYLCSVLMLTGIPLVLGHAMQASPKWRSDSSLRSPWSLLSAWLCGALLSVFTIAVSGAWLNLQLTEAWPIPARWARFPFLFLALLPISLAEELTLGDLRPLGRSALAGRWALFVILRTIVWLVFLLAWFSGVSSALLPTIFLLFLAMLSLAQRIGADALRYRTGSALAASIFNAILGAWFLAAAFPLA